MSATLHDAATRWFLLIVSLGAILYAAMGLSPSSYGIVLERLGAEGSGPIAGTPREIRSDEWAILTPEFQIAVRNRFERINATSFYHEDLRHYGALPLRDWSLIFKPQMWAFFVLSPAAAFSTYFAIFNWAFLCGYYLLFRQLGATAWFAIAGSAMICFSGFAQFWWTTFLPMLAVYPWMALLTLRPMPPWKKALLGLWAFPFFVFAHAYPPLLLTLAWCTLFLALAFRPALFRSFGELAALAAGLAAAGIAAYVYLADVIPVMRNTVYPGHRIAPAGATPWAAALSQFYPFFSFRLTGFENLTGDNICEIGAVGSFLPLLTLCATRYRDLLGRRETMRALAVLLGGFVAITLWQLAPVPGWIGRALLWDTSTSTRWLFASGLLLTAACLAIWRDGLISLSTRRLALFVGAGLAGSIVLKFAWLSAGAESMGELAAQNRLELALLAGAVLIAGVAWPKEGPARMATALAIAGALNVAAFGRFNPLQPARPIFEVPETAEMGRLRAAAAAAPGGLLLEPAYLGSILNGLGFRSVNQYLLAPKLALFRTYFPAMAPERFNQLFNRSGHIQLTDDALPAMQNPYMTGVPIEVFRPIRNVRRVEMAPGPTDTCSGAAVGGVDKVAERGATLAIAGWAPWRGEDAADGIRIVSARPLRDASIATASRPDVAEQLRDYGFVKAGFHLEVSSADGKALHANEVVLLAFGNALGASRLPCCGCP